LAMSTSSKKHGLKQIKLDYRNSESKYKES
jgi:hypothetical protein